MWTKGRQRKAESWLEIGEELAPGGAAYLRDAIAEIERLHKLIPKVPAHWDAEEREQAEAALSGEPASIFEAHCQQCLQRALGEIDQLQARIETLERKFHDR